MYNVYVYISERVFEQPIVTNYIIYRYHVRRLTRVQHTQDCVSLFNRNSDSILYALIVFVCIVTFRKDNNLDCDIRFFVHY